MPHHGSGRTPAQWRARERRRVEEARKLRAKGLIPGSLKFDRVLARRMGR